MEKIEVRPEDLSENHREYARVIGIDSLINLCKEFGGTQIYIPKVEELTRPRLYKTIKEEYDEGNSSMSGLARKYGVSESTVYRLVRDQMGKKNIPGQMDTFDYIKQ